MSKAIRKVVFDCAHCRVTNTTSRQAQHVIGALSMDEPFDVISMDVWHPGSTKNTVTTMKNQRAVLTSLWNLTGFASLVFIPPISHYFIPNGLPKLVIIDGGSEFKEALIAMCDQLGVWYYVALPEVHTPILCKHFHRYLNKVQRIRAVDTQSYEHWALNALFAAYMHGTYDW
jgi:hypothetical protein